jgi:hypothetical protein
MSMNRSKSVVLGCHRKKRNSIFVAILFTFTLVFTGGGWVATHLLGDAAAQDVGSPVAPAAPTIGDSGDLQTVPYILNLPAGINLISAPFDAGSGPAIEAFEGIEPGWPLFFEWDSSSQRFLGPEDSMLGLGAGYWYYAPAPTTLLIRGKPYSALTHLTKDITPGWHLFGVPFTEGIDWSGFHLYASGNPIGLETARDLGWISSDILTMQGSSWQTHEAGMPFEPGLAYWIKTTVPLSIRATPPSIVSAVGGPTPVMDSVFTNIVKVIDNKNNLIKTGADILGGKLKTGLSSGAGAVFALANMAVSAYRYNNIMNDLNAMDDKVDELLTDMKAVQGQLTEIERQLSYLTSWIQSEQTLGVHVTAARSWIETYYSDPTIPKSYNWALWLLAGCDVTAITCESGACVGGSSAGAACTDVRDCYSCTNTVTDTSLQAFTDNHVTKQNVDPPAVADDNFYLWWAYSVLQESTLPPFLINGNNAKAIVNNIHNGMVPQKPTDINGLQEYMKEVFNNSTCAKDVTACDLYSQVYLPLEAYFQEAITDQITLAQAIVESYAELASFYETAPIHSGNPTAHDSDVNVYMTGFQQKLAEEAESFVEVAEQIALYRAADGRFDWSSFNTSDAAQVLARADFMAARLVSSATGKPWPWPPGVTGRIFYTESQLPLNIPHNACPPGDAYNCTTLTEVAPPPQDFNCKQNADYPNECFLTGDWPYLQWHLESGVAIGVPTTTWKVRRLTPQDMAVGTYEVWSINSGGGKVNLLVSEYGDDYSNPPAEGTTPVRFGSFNNVEGSLGIGGLGDNRTYSGGSNDKVHTFTRTQFGNYTQMTVAYKDANSTGAALSGNWYEYIKIKVPDNSVFGGFPYIRVFWPATINISLGSYRAGNCCDDYYYQKVEQSLRLLDSSSNSKAGQPFVPCTTGAYGFGSCSYSTQDRNDPKTMLASSPPIALNHSMTYTLQAHFSDEIIYYYGAPSCYCQPYPKSGSQVIWNVFNPTITLTK